MAQKRIKSRLPKLFGIFLLLAGVATLYQNCGGGFESGATGSLGSGGIVEDPVVDDNVIISNGQGDLWFDPLQVRMVDANTAIVMDRLGESLTSVSLLDGRRTTLTGLGVGAGPALTDPFSFYLGPNAQTAYVASRGGAESNIISVNLANGDRAVVSGAAAGVGLGDPLSTVTDIWVHPAGQIIYVLAVGGSIYSINVATGDRTLLGTIAGGAFAMSVNADGTEIIALQPGLNFLKRYDVVNLTTMDISSDVIGVGPMPALTLSFDLDRNSNIAYVMDFSDGAVYSVDLITGDRAIVSNAQTGGGSLITRSRGIALNPAVTTAYAVDSNLESLFSINLATGDRRIVSSAQAGSGYEINFSIAGALSPNGTDYYALEGRVFRINIGTGIRQLVSGEPAGVYAGIGNGPAFGNSTDMQVNDAATEAFVSTLSTNSIIRVNLLNGNRSILVDQTIGVGPIVSPRAFRLNQAETIAYVASSGGLSQFYAIDIATGDRTLISGTGVGVGPELGDVSKFILNPGETTAYVISDNSIIGINLVTGDRAEISGSTVGAGDAFSNIANLVPNQDFTSFFVGGDSLYRVDLATGDRIVLSGFGAGDGAFDLRLQGFDVRANDTELYGFASAISAFVRIDLSNGNKSIFSN